MYKARLLLYALILGITCPLRAVEIALQKLAGQLQELSQSLTSENGDYEEDELDALLRKDKYFAKWYQDKLHQLNELKELRASILLKQATIEHEMVFALEKKQQKLEDLDRLLRLPAAELKRRYKREN